MYRRLDRSNRSGVGWRGVLSEARSSSLLRSDSKNFEKFLEHEIKSSSYLTATIQETIVRVLI